MSQNNQTIDYSNNLDYARQQVEFDRPMDFSPSEYVDHLAAGEFEATYEDRRASEAEQAAEEARRYAQAAAAENRIEAPVAPTPEYTPEQKAAVIEYSKHIMRNLRAARDYELAA